MTDPVAWTSKSYGRAMEIVRQIVDMQRELFDLGLIETAQNLSKATQAIGWEISRKIEAQNKRELAEKRIKCHDRPDRRRA